MKVPIGALDIVVAVCVVIFVITAVASVLQLLGIRVIRDPQQARTLFRVLIVEIVVVAVAAFGKSLNGGGVTRTPIHHAAVGSVTPKVAAVLPADHTGSYLPSST